MARKNEIIMKDDYAILIINSPKYGIKEVLIDKEDIDKIQNFKWHLNPNYNHKKEVYYIESEICKNKIRKTISLHRYLMNFPEDKVIDHINHNTLDNRKINLRICTQYENSLNRQEVTKTNVPHKDNKLGIKYISYFKKHGRNYYLYKVDYNKVQKEFRELKDALCFLIGEVVKDVFG